MTAKIASSASVLTTNSYVDLISIELLPWVRMLLIWLKEENTNAVKYKVLASNDGSRWETLKAETIIANNGSTWEWLTDSWRYLKVQHKASVDGSQGKTTCIVSGN